MKKSFWALLFMAVVGIVLMSTFGKESSVFAETGTKYYSKTNAPVFYGATEITIDKNVVETFDIKDSRFRIFAKDFEDGDLSHKIEHVSNDVDAKTPGNYSVSYKVTDSHGNETEITVPVHVLDKEEKECCIVRTLYTLPSVWNIELAGTQRCHAGDRQILGIYMPSDSSVEIRPVEMDQNITLNFLANYGSRETSATIKNTNTDFVSFMNSKQVTVDGVSQTVSYGSVPLILTTFQEKGAPINKTYKIEIKFNDSVKPLNYYHYKDNEEEFKYKWRSSGESFGIVDGEAIMVVVPYMDVDKLSNYKVGSYDAPFESLDAFLEYYLEVVNRMDAMIGLSLNPVKATDQNVRVKYLAKANGDSSGGAYYNGNHIAVKSSSVSAVFQYGWGTLHEIAHGYQGSLGRGVSNGYSMCLNETGNNILAHYIQIDKEVYLKSDDWMGGSLENIEKSRNQKRISGESIFHNNDGTYTNVGEKLYFVVNLLDAFEGTTTYAKLFSYYRTLINEKGQNCYTIPEVYALFFAQEYKVNIIPYLKQWTLPIGAAVEEQILESKLPAMSVLGDAISDEATMTAIKEGENISLQYGLVSDSVLEKYNVTSDLKIHIDIDNIDEIAGKNIILLKNGEIFSRVKVESEDIEIKNIQTGTYEIKFPVNFNYSSGICSATLKQGENSLNYQYEKITSDAELLVSINICGIFGTTGYNMDLTNKNKAGKVTLSGADLGNRDGSWKNRTDDVFVSVTILNEKDEEIDKLEVKGEQYFSELTLANPIINFEYGYKIRIYSNKPQYVRVLSTATKQVISDYSCSDQTITYEVTSAGLKLLNKEDFNTEEVTYAELKKEYEAILEAYKAKVTEEELQNKSKNLDEKSRVISAYDKLKEEDRTEYSELIQKIKKGGSPTILIEDEIIKVGQDKDPKKIKDLDLYSLITIIDNEDLVIDSNSTNVTIETNLDRSQVGIYSLKYTVRDSDGNIATKTIQISVEQDGSESASTKTVIYILMGVFVVLMIAYIAVSIVKNNKIKNKKR